MTDVTTSIATATAITVVIRVAPPTNSRDANASIGHSKIRDDTCNARRGMLASIDDDVARRLLVFTAHFFKCRSSYQW